MINFQDDRDKKNNVKRDQTKQMKVGKEEEEEKIKRQKMNSKAIN